MLAVLGALWRGYIRSWRQSCRLVKQKLRSRSDSWRGRGGIIPSYPYARSLVVSPTITISPLLPFNSPAVMRRSILQSLRPSAGRLLVDARARRSFASTPRSSAEAEITIDGKKVSIELGAALIQACEKAGVTIPRYCYHVTSLRLLDYSSLNRKKNRTRRADGFNRRS